MTGKPSEDSYSYFIEHIHLLPYPIVYRPIKTTVCIYVPAQCSNSILLNTNPRPMLLVRVLWIIVFLINITVVGYTASIYGILCLPYVKVLSLANQSIRNSITVFQACERKSVRMVCLEYLNSLSMEIQTQLSVLQRNTPEEHLLELLIGTLQFCKQAITALSSPKPVNFTAKEWRPSHAGLGRKVSNKLLIWMHS